MPTTKVARSTFANGSDAAAPLGWRQLTKRICFARPARPQARCRRVGLTARLGRALPFANGQPTHEKKQAVV